jgi:phytanoyl-CoA hydroxylase
VSLADDYVRDGHVVAPGAAGDDLLTAAERHLAGLAVTAKGIVACSPVSDPVARWLGDDESLSGLARQVLGPEPELFGLTYVVKPPGEGLPVLWHQDGHPWKERWGIEHAVTLWVALDPADRANGCLRVVSGSHHSPVRPLRPSPTTDDVFGWECDSDLVDESRAVDVVLARGDVSIHHPALVHGSWPNTSDRRRAALSLRYRAAT